MNQARDCVKDLRVLYLEDNPRDVEIVRAKLAESGFSLQVECAANKHEFASLLACDRFNVVLADYQLVDLDAPAALQLTRSICPHLPFICISGAVSAETAIELLKQGAVDYVLKDRLERLPYAIKRAVDEARDKEIRRQAESARDKLNAQLELKVKELEEVVYVASHDLRTPLVTLEGFSGVLDEALQEISTTFDKEPLSSAARAWLTPFFADSREAIRYIRKSTASMSSLLRGLLQVSREARIEVAMERTDMDSLMSTVLTAFKYQTEERGVKTVVSSLPSCVGDARQLNQVFSNLISNALKYAHPERPCVIKISGQTEGDHSVYCVADNGQGISPEYHGKIFEIFHQLDPAIEGDGLGLSIVRKIVGRHDGKLWVESEAGKGSRFYVSLCSGELPLPQGAEGGPQL